jgi:hypothetical protein
MKKLGVTMKWLLLLAVALIILPLGCRAQPTTPPVVYSVPDLKYRLISRFDDVFWCDPDFYPVAREGQEEKNALEQFSIIRANVDEFSDILEHLGLSNKAEYTAEEQLLVYREHKKLTYALELTPSGNVYQFTLRTGEGQGYRIEGTITSSGEIKILKRETSFNTCPICLARGTLIDTPSGPVAVEWMRKGMAVWTVNKLGKRVMAKVLETVTTPVPTSFQIVRIRLNDGRTVTASSGHPTGERRALGDYRVGDTLGGALVIAVERLAYDGGTTYDLLPSGETGLYWANGVLLKSTLTTN